jgi:hypothetical protein
MVKPRRGIDWTGIRIGKRVKPRSFTEGMLESVKRYQRDKLVREQEERGRDEVPTIIPFPSDQAQAADGSSDT